MLFSFQSECSSLHACWLINSLILTLIRVTSMFVGGFSILKVDNNHHLNEGINCIWRVCGGRILCPTIFFIVNVVSCAEVDHGRLIFSWGPSWLGQKTINIVKLIGVDLNTMLALPCHKMVIIQFIAWWRSSLGLTIERGFV